MNGRVFAALIGLICCAADTAQEHAEKGVASARAGDLVHAEAELRSAVQLAPNNAFYLTSLGGILGMEQKLAEANVYFEKAVKIDPENAAARRNLAANQWRLGELKPAQANLEHLLAKQPNDKVAILLLGMVSENERNYARAAKLLAAVPDLVEQRPESVAALASAYYHTGRRQEGHKSLEGLLARPASPQGILAAAGVAIRAEDYGIAERLLESIQSKFTTARASGEIYNLLGMVEMKMDQFTDAVRYYGKAVELDPKSVDAAAGLASAKWAAGMHAEADAEFQTLLKQHPGDAAVYENYGTSLANSATDDAMLDRAAALLKKSVELDGSRAEAHYELGMLELKRNAPDSMQQALEQLQTAVKLGFNSSKVHYALARIYRRLGRESEAAAEMHLYEQTSGGMQGK